MQKFSSVWIEISFRVLTKNTKKFDNFIIYLLLFTLLALYSSLWNLNINLKCSSQKLHRGAVGVKWHQLMQVLLLDSFLFPAPHIHNIPSQTSAKLSTVSSHYVLSVWPTMCNSISKTRNRQKFKTLSPHEPLVLSNWPEWNMIHKNKLMNALLTVLGMLSSL